MQASCYSKAKTKNEQTKNSNCACAIPAILNIVLRRRDLYEQLTGEGSISAKLRTSTERQAEALKKAAAGKVVLVVLDGKLVYFSW